MVKPDAKKAFMTDDLMPPEDRKFRKELSAGITALALLGIMDGAPAPLYGYSEAKLMEERGDGARIVKHGTLYPVLRSLEGAGQAFGWKPPSSLTDCWEAAQMNKGIGLYHVASYGSPAELAEMYRKV